MTNVLIVDDSRIAQDIMINRIKQSSRYNVIAVIENAANAEIVCMRGKVDLILMDVCTADDESGIESSAKIKELYPNIKIIIMTSMPEYSFIKKAREAGCDSFYYKEFGDEDLVDICDRTMAGESVYPDTSPVIKLGYIDSTELTEREFEVISELALGYKYEEIADKLNISVNTVKYHIKNLLAKTGYRSSIQLVADAIEKKLILPKY